MTSWYGVDFDATLVEYEGYKGPGIFGAPIPRMVARVRQWLAEGIEVRIFTARVYPGTNEHSKRNAEIERDAITTLCEQLFGQPLKVTHQKDYGMLRLYDDRCIQVQPNTGRILTEEGWQ